MRLITLLEAPCAHQTIAWAGRLEIPASEIEDLPVVRTLARGVLVVCMDGPWEEAGPSRACRQGQGQS